LEPKINSIIQLVCWRFYDKTKVHRICKMSWKEDKILIKNIATRKEVWYEEIACRVPNKLWPLTTVKCLQRKIVDTGTDNRQFGSEIKIKVIWIKIQYKFSNMLLILYVKYLLLLSCMGHFFWSQCIYHLLGIAICVFFMKWHRK